MEPNELQRFQKALVIFGSQPSDASNLKAEITRPAKAFKFRRMAASRCINRSSTITSSSRPDFSRSRNEHANSHLVYGTRQKVSFTFSPDMLALPLSRMCPTETPIDVSRPEAPVDKLPVELLGEIFIRCLPEIYFFLPRPTLAPMLLCQICGYWRQVALATPKLWVRVYAPGRPYYNNSHLSLLELWMKRSFDHPLSLHFGPDIDFWGSHDPAFELILSQTHRWRYLSLALSEKIVDQFLETYAGGVTSSLQVLKLDASACTVEQACQIVQALKQFPHLRRLQFARHTSTPLLEAPWSQMTHIWLTCPMSDQQCLEILSHCSQVEDFRLSHIITPANFAPSKKIVLSKLFFLQIHSAEDARTIFDNINCPSLRNLHLKRWRSGSRAPLSFADFLSRSGCKLESFNLHDDELSEDDLIRHLQAPPLKLLRILELECRRLSSKTLKLLSYTADSDAAIVLLPSLHTIWFKISYVAEDVFQQMAESRLDKTVVQPDGVVGASLKNVFIGRNRHPVCREGKILKPADITPSTQCG